MKTKPTAKVPTAKMPTAKMPTAREFLGALGEHVEVLRPSVNERPKKRQVTAALATARTINSAMGIVRTSIYATKTLGAAMPFLQLEDSKS